MEDINKDLLPGGQHEQHESRDGQAKIKMNHVKNETRYSPSEPAKSS